MRSCSPPGTPRVARSRTRSTRDSEVCRLTELEAELEWPNSTLLHGDILAAVAELKQASSGNLAIMGGGELIVALMAADLIDQYLLIIHPLVLGATGVCSAMACVRRCGSPTSQPTPRAS